MRIGIFTSEYAGVTAYTGGVGVHYAALAPELLKQGHDVRVFLVAERDTAAPSDGVPVEVVAPGRVRGSWRVTPLLRSIALARVLRMRHERIDLLFGPEWEGLAGITSSLPGAAPIVTNLVTSLLQIEVIEGSGNVTGAERSRRAVQRLLERHQTTRSDGIAASSTAILRWASEAWDLSGIPVRVLPNFIDMETTRRRGEGAAPPGFPDSGPVVLFFGRLEKRKGIEILADAMPRVWDRHPNAQLVLVGPDTMLDGLPVSDLLRRRLHAHSRQMHYLGPHPADRTMAAVARADVVVLPSLWENFSLAALEARALGRPIVATSGSGFDDFFTDDRDGLLVPPSDATALATAVIRLLDDPALRNRLGARAATDALRYTPSGGIGPYIDFFADTVARVRDQSRTRHRV